MLGSENNHHPSSLQQAPDQEVTGKVVALLRQLRPQVVITFDPQGAYGHPDHIKMHRVATEAFFAAADPNRFPELKEKGLEPHQAQRLYYTTFPRRVLKFWLWILPLAGKDPSRFGVNQDIDLRAVASWIPEATARINIRRFLPLKMKAGSCYQSQVAPMRDFPLPHWLRNWLMGIENFTRAHPPPEGSDGVEKDLFAGL
jgi:LmbE family N-acetylglucosaminyl deacetylase